MLNAASMNYTDELHQLLTCQYASTETLDFRGCNDSETPLTSAVLGGQYRTVEQLLWSGASPDFPNKNHETPLMIAAANSNEFQNYKDICDLLLHHGADPNASNKYDTTALKEAVSHRNTEVATCLLEHGAKVNFYDITSTIFQNEPQTLKLLLDYVHHQNVRIPLPRLLDLAGSASTEQCAMIDDFAMITLQQGYYPPRETIMRYPFVSFFHESAHYGLVKMMSVLAELNPQFLQEGWLIQKRVPWRVRKISGHMDYILSLQEYRKQVPSLSKLCKSTILAQLSAHDGYYKANVNFLPLPKCLKSYLLVTESVYNHTV